MAVDLRRQWVQTSLVDQMVKSYRELPAIEHLGKAPLPDRSAVIAIVEGLTELIFPGFSGWVGTDGADVADRVAAVLEDLRDRLADQAARALRHAALCLKARDAKLDDPLALESLAQSKTDAFLRSLPRVRLLIATDVQAAYDGDPAAGSAVEIIACYPGLAAITVYRLAHELHSLGVPLIPRIMSEWAHSRTGIDIHPGARIGAGFFIDHGTGVVIGETCEIEEHVKLYQGVTLGALSFETDAHGKLVRGTKRHPTIQQKVVIYANATILGGTTVIGAHSIVGAGASITKSVPPNTVVTIEKPSLRFRDAS